MRLLGRPILPFNATPILQHLRRRRSIPSFIESTFLYRFYSYDHIVIGAGVVGLAVAAKLAEFIPQQFDQITNN